MCKESPPPQERNEEMGHRPRQQFFIFFIIVCYNLLSEMISSTLKETKTAKFAVFNIPSVAKECDSEGVKSPRAATTASMLDVAEDESKLRKSVLSVEEKVAMTISVGEEVITPDELSALFTAREHPVVYDGFEPSGRMHIAQGVLRAINVNKLTSCGCLFKFWVADWFAQLNNKMGGDLNKIKTVGMYMIEIWKAIGMDMTNVRFLWASDEINAHADEYWSRVMEIARMNSLPRIQRCCTIMGRKDTDEMSASQIFYPCMQASDIFFLKADICQLGMDQRKVNMLAREYAGAKKMRFKPIIVSHHMLMGLKEGQEKMSKSDPESAIFMEDTAADVKRKIKKAFCPPEIVEGNPIVDYTKHIIFGYFGTITINTNGENVVYDDYNVLEEDYKQGKIWPGDLKPAVTEALNRILEPVRIHFASGEPKKLLEKIKKFKVTR